MFSLDRFYHVLHNNLIASFLNGRSVYFYPFGTYQNINILTDKVDTARHNYGPEKYWPDEQEFFHCYFFDQEPLYDDSDIIVRNSILNQTFVAKPKRINLLANSEISAVKDHILEKFGFHDWYYFYHGFAALDWYRDFQYVNSSSFNRFDKVFICYNHLTSKLRSYRLHLVSDLIEQDLIKHGRVSLFHQGWQQTIEDPDTPLDNRARVKIYQALQHLKDPLTIDTSSPAGSLSASVNLDNLTSALFHVVTETVYFLPKLHLTEKVFKPIVARRPFFLVAAPGNLAYLKSYGFRTFDQWIDESYDTETDHYVRIEKITAEIKRLCNLSTDQLKQMHAEMQEVLEYNFHHFYNGFKEQIVNELVDNFACIVHQTKNHQQFDLSQEYLEQVKKRLKQ
jgi:hypothetical protein